MPTSSAMKTTMLGFLVAVCADAIPPQARKTVIIAVARKLRPIIDVSFHFRYLLAGQRMWFPPCFRSARIGATKRHYVVAAHPVDKMIAALARPSSSRISVALRFRCRDSLFDLGLQIADVEARPR